MRRGKNLYIFILYEYGGEFEFYLSPLQVREWRKISLSHNI